MAAVSRRLSLFSSYRSSIKKLSTTSTVDPNEVSNFNNLSSQWWDEGGEFKPLHSMNTLRVPFIRNCLINSGLLPRESSSKLLSLSGLKILDVGCGGGILSEPLARIGAQVIGLDASKEAVNIAQEHAKTDPDLLSRLTYKHGSLEDMAESHESSFDAVVASEVIEHMTSAEQCVKLCSQLIKPGGSMFVTTLNRTSISWMAGIVLAERVLKIVPPDTHDWNKFVTPQELKNILEDHGCSVRLIHGMAYNPLNNSWCWSKYTAINYALHAIKKQP